MKPRLLILAPGYWDSLSRSTKEKIFFVLFVGGALCLTPSVSLGDATSDLFSTQMDHARQMESINDWNSRLKTGKSPRDNPKYDECNRAHGDCTYNICDKFTSERSNRFKECWDNCDAQREACLSGSSSELSSPASTGNGNMLANPTQSFAMLSDPNVQVKLGERARAIKDEAKATQWFSLAAANGHSKAQLFLGFRYLYGVGAPKNPAMADFWLRKAAAQGEPVAQEELMRQATTQGEQSLRDTIKMINTPIK